MLRPDTAPEVFAFYGTRFHLGIAEASGNPILLTVMLVLTSRLARFVTETCTIPELRNSAAADHEPIFAAIVARQPVAARRAMRDHFRVLVERFHDDPASLRDGPADEPGAPDAGGRAGPA
jgi:DNA-binding FadR family transcriptional regulator